MPVTFANNNVLPIEAIGLMGVNVKVTESPFGFFGTGLKFAIATLLRTGHKIEIVIKGKRHELTLTPTTIREVVFDVITLDGKELGYTTEAGKNWEVWQAYRELACNAMDEIDSYVGFSTFADTERETIIRVYGAGIEKAHEDRSLYFCEGAIVQRCGAIGEIRAGNSKAVFYRGVKIADLEQPSLYTYNILQPTLLTEDRVMKNQWSLPSVIGKMIAHVEDELALEQLLLMNDKAWEGKADFTSITEFSPIFLDTVEKHSDNWECNNSAKRVLWAHRPRPDPIPKTIKLDDLDAKAFRSAWEICQTMDPDFDLDPKKVHFVPTLGTGALGEYKNGKVFIAREAFNGGEAIVAGTLYEEWVHLKHQHPDESRVLQNFFLNRLVAVAQRLTLYRKGADSADDIINYLKRDLTGEEEEIKAKLVAGSGGIPF
jgi:hypothetical protein